MYSMLDLIKSILIYNTVLVEGWKTLLFQRGSIKPYQVAAMNMQKKQFLKTNLFLCCNGSCNLFELNQKAAICDIQED